MGIKTKMFVVLLWVLWHPDMPIPAAAQGERDVFTTNLHPATKVVIGDIANRMKSTQGHILVRVLPGGKQYYIYILEDRDTKRKVKTVHGPYSCDE